MNFYELGKREALEKFAIMGARPVNAHGVPQIAPVTKPAVTAAPGKPAAVTPESALQGLLLKGLSKETPQTRGVYASLR